MKVSEQIRQAAGGLSWHIPSEVQEMIRKVYLRLHTMKAEFDRMEEIPKDLQPIYSKVSTLAGKTAEMIQESEQIKGLVRRVMQHYQR